jgi:hypothetical protein
MFLQHIAVNQATSSTVATNIAITFKVTDGIAMITGLIIIIKKIDAMIAVDITTRTRGTASPTTRRMIASVITSRKRVTRSCTMTSPLHQAPAVRLENGVDLNLLCMLTLILALAQAAGATKIIMSNNMIACQVQHSNMGVRTPRMMMTDITIARTRVMAFLLPSLLQR